MSKKPTTLIELLEQSEKKYTEKPALLMSIYYRTHTLSYAKLLSLSKQTAVWLEGQGVGLGDTVLMNAPSSPYAVVAYFATLMRGAIFVPVNTQSTKEMIRGIAHSCEAKILFTHSHAYSDPELGLPTYALETLTDLIKDVSQTAYKPPEISPDTIAQIMYTSGTTGEPKGVILTHKNILTTALEVAKNVHITHKDRILSILPISHIYEQVVGLFAPLSSGAQIVYLHRPSALISLMRKHHITMMPGVPEFLRILMGKIEQAAEKAGKDESLTKLMKFSSKVPSMALRRIIVSSVHQRLGGALKIVASGGSPLDEELERKWNALGIRLLQGYGLTEVSGVATMNTPEAHKERAVGKPISGVKIKLGADNEILINGKSVFQGYYKREEVTKEVLTDDGWFHTGDIGEIDADGFLYIKGRKKYMLKGAGGQNIYPEDIENELDAEEEIRDSCVIALESGDHMLITAVVRTETDEVADFDAIQQRVNKRLASYQAVNKILLWPEYDFPRSASKKIKRDPVQKWAQETFDMGSADTQSGQGSRLANLLADVTGMDVAGIEPTSSLVTDLGLDSLMRVELVSRIELEFGVLIDETKIAQETTVTDIEKMIESAEPVSVQQPFIRWPLTLWARVLRKYLVTPFLNTFSNVFFTTHAYGLKNLENVAGPCLIMPNHTSAIDSVAVTRTLPKHLNARLSHAAGADIKLFKEYKLLANIVRLWMNVFALPRTGDFRIEDGLAYVGWMLDKKCSVVIYPEGNTKHDDSLLPIKEGAALLATQMQVPVIPVYITGIAEVMEPKTGKVIGLFKKVHVRYGEPIHFSPVDSMEEARMKIAMKLGELRTKATELEAKLYAKY